MASSKVWLLLLLLFFNFILFFVAILLATSWWLDAFQAFTRVHFIIYLILPFNLSLFQFHSIPFTRAAFVRHDILTSNLIIAFKILECATFSSNACFFCLLETLPTRNFPLSFFRFRLCAAFFLYSSWMKRVCDCSWCCLHYQTPINLMLSRCQIMLE